MTEKKDKAPSITERLARIEEENRFLRDATLRLGNGFNAGMSAVLANQVVQSDMLEALISVLGPKLTLNDTELRATVVTTINEMVSSRQRQVIAPYEADILAKLAEGKLVVTAVVGGGSTLVGPEYTRDGVLVNLKTFVNVSVLAPDVAQEVVGKTVPFDVQFGDAVFSVKEAYDVGAPRPFLKSV